MSAPVDGVEDVPRRYRYLEPLPPGRPGWVVGARLALMSALALWVVIFAVGFLIQRAIT